MFRRVKLPVTTGEIITGFWCVCCGYASYGVCVCAHVCCGYTSDGVCERMFAADGYAMVCGQSTHEAEIPAVLSQDEVRDQEAVT